MYRLLARWLIVIGACLTGLGVFFYYQLEQHRTLPSGDIEYAFLRSTFLPTLLVGLLVTLVGSVSWAWYAPILRLAICGAALSASALLATRLTPINIHGWTGSLELSYATALFIGALFLLFASVRFTFSKLTMRQK